MSIRYLVYLIAELKLALLTHNINEKKEIYSMLLPTVVSKFSYVGGQFSCLLWASFFKGIRLAYI